MSHMSYMSQLNFIFLRNILNVSKLRIFSNSYLFLVKQRFCKYQLIFSPDLNFFSSESSLDKDVL